jgi:DNA polymerase I
MGKQNATVNTDHKWLNLPDETMQVYNCFDTLATVRAAKGLRQTLTETGQLHYFESRVWPLVEPILAMQRRGIPVCRDTLNAYRESVRLELAETVTSVERLIPNGARFNLNSPPQRASLLYDTCGLKVPPPTRDRPARSTNQAAMTWIIQHLRKRDEPFRGVLEGLFHRSRLNTILSRYLDFAIRDDRVFPRIKLTGAETGRLAYADPAIQQYPEEVRVIFKTKPGNVLLGADYSQIEARILAILSQDRASIEVFEAGGDVHAANARDLFGLTPVQWSDLSPKLVKEYRNFAKAFLYGISYGGNPETLKTKLFCPCPRCVAKVPPTATLGKDEVVRASQRWFHIHAPVPRWRDALVESVRYSKTYTNPMGRKRYFCAPYPEYLRELYNCPMQSTAAEIINDATIRLHKLNAPLILQHHDALVLEVPEAEVQFWGRVLKAEMERSVPELGDAVFPVDLTWGSSWGSLKSLDLVDAERNPSGNRA